MNLRSILNRSRFEGCVNPRAERRGKKLSLFCAETEEGACLMMERAGETSPLAEAELPPHLLERVLFWNTWCSSGFNGESEAPPSLFGLEAYAVSIGVQVLQSFPEYAVDWCGLPLHDDRGLMCAMEADDAMPCPATDYQLNRYAAQLMRGDCPAVLPKGCMRGYDYWDWNMCDICLVYHGTHDWWTDERTIWVWDDGQLPPWLVQLHEEVSELRARAAYWSVYTPVETWWKPSPLLVPLLEAALSVDWARTLYPLRPVSMNELYLTGEDVLRLCHPESGAGKRLPYARRRPRRMLVQRGGKGFVE